MVGRSSSGRLPDHLAAAELLARQVDVDPRHENISADEVMDDKRRDVALTAARILGLPAVVLVGRVECPGRANGLLELCEREHAATVTRAESGEGRVLGSPPMSGVDRAAWVTELRRSAYPTMLRKARTRSSRMVAALSSYSGRPRSAKRCPSPG